MADAKIVQLGHAGKADGRWRLYAFADQAHPSLGKSLVFDLCYFLLTSSESPIRKYTPAGDDIDSVFDLRAIFQQSHYDLEIEQLPALLRPQKGQYGLYDYEKVFCPDVKNAQDIFDIRGIDRAKGALIVVRPDQYIAQVMPLDAFQKLAQFFDAFMLESAR